MNRLTEAHQILDSTIKTIVDNNLTDLNLVDHVGVVARELGVYEKVMVIYENIVKGKNVDKKQMQNLFSIYAGMKEFYKMYMLANQIAQKFNDNDWKIHAAACLFQFSKGPAAPPGSLDMTKMTLDMMAKDSRGVCDLYISLLEQK